ncbi:MAG: hypothetical protein Q8O43_04155 [Dehalococcoidia bacterium]|nr:hypothetical protein [Dehalococcoidia bacterium]
MNVADQVQQQLRALNGYDALLALFEALGFSYANEPHSTVDWTESVKRDVSDFRLAARHGAFNVFYVVIPESHMFSRERQITSKILATEPHSLIVFTEPAHRLWHFVHVRYDERLERRKQLRRFVVDLGEEHTETRLRTTAERLARIAIQPSEQVSVLEMQERCDEAFRISEVTRGFLKSFVSVVADLTNALLKNNPALLKTEPEALCQAQLLMDRLVFLYFVQKKNWLNGEPAYLYLRFRKCYEADHGQDTFYRERLLPLFRALSHRAAQRPHTDDGKDEALPFLNGGLFDLPLSYGTANPPIDERLRLPNQALYSVFEDFLERYNFTTTEDTPLDVEVAINPEVIGTIFETFVLTSENEPETNAPDRRKATGSYYTPRCVVHFICQAVFRRYLASRTGIAERVVKELVEYLPAQQLSSDEEKELVGLMSVKDAEKLREAAVQIRACDPAVGSGAFPVGLLQEVVKLVSLLDLRIKGRDYIQHLNYAHDLKKRVIEECLYGVDIQEQAVQICELRLWLSLVVDYETDERLPLIERISQIEPLPNLTFRIRVGDSLIDQIFGRNWDVKNQRHDDLTSELTARKRSYYESQTPEGKRDLERQIIVLQLRLLERLLEAERLETGADLPMLDEMVSAQQRLRVTYIKMRLQEIDDLLKHCRTAMGQANQPVAEAWEHTRRFDAIRKQLGVSFIWELDFAEAFDPARSGNGDNKKGFDVIVGNPPFVTARNPEKREQYRRRWPTSCYKKYHLLAPFTELALSKLLRKGGQLGYIVSNAFATRDFGKPLVEQVFQQMELQNVVDCSGLMFPGHGTPTCILLGYTVANRPKLTTYLCGTKPGMGQLHEEAEETELWAEIEDGWENPTFKGKRMEVAEWTEDVARAHPWSLNAAGTNLKDSMEEGSSMLDGYSPYSVSYSTVSGKDAVFVLPFDSSRRFLLKDLARLFVLGEELRDWSVTPSQLAIHPFSDDGLLLEPELLSAGASKYFARFRGCLENRQGMLFQQGMKKGEPWYRYEYYDQKRAGSEVRIIWAFIATHISACDGVLGLQTNRSINDFIPGAIGDPKLFLALLNSSSALFYLRQICFCKRESSNPETDNYYEFAGGKVEQLSVPRLLLEDNHVKERTSLLAGKCSVLGALVPGLHPRKLFEMPREAYTDWYGGIRGYQLPHPALNLKWRTASELLRAWRWAIDEMHTIRRQMIALQEEMDWLMYGAYQILPLNHPAVNLHGPPQPQAIDRIERPYRLVQNNQSSPPDWSVEQRRLWQARLDAIAEEEFIGQVENPAYKRRWEEPFGDKDFLTAYEWWLREKAEWWLENKHKGGPISLDVWAAELWQDRRVRAAYEAALEIGQAIGDKDYQREAENGNQARHLKRVIEEETVPDRRDAFKKKHEKLRSISAEKHLPNGVPRERFRSVTDKPGYYVWAGKDIWGGVQGDKWDD